MADDEEFQRFIRPTDNDNLLLRLLAGETVEEGAIDSSDWVCTAAL